MSALMRKKLEAEPGEGMVMSAVWHPNEALLAVRYTASVTVHSLFGSSVSETSSTSSSTSTTTMLARVKKEDNSEVAALSWNPALRMLAVAWGDGGLTTWSEGEKPFEESSVHAGTCATAIAWHPTGKRLAVGDVSGAVSVWACDRNGRLSLVCKFASSIASRAAVASIVFRTDGGTHQQSFPFFVGCADGSVLAGDDTGGTLAESVTVGAPIAEMWYLADRDSVVAATTAGTLAHFRSSVSPGKLELSGSVKLNTAGNGSSSARREEMIADDAEESSFANEAAAVRRNVAWCSSGIVACLTRERLVRMWNAAQSRSFILSPPTSSGKTSDIDDSNDSIVCIAFHEKTHELAAATVSGIVFLWKFVSQQDDQQIAEQSWIPTEPLNIENGGVSELAFGPGDRLLSAVVNGAVEVFSESAMACSMRDGTAAFLVGPNRVVVERIASFDNATPAAMTAIVPEIGVRWLQASKNAVVLWNGQQCATYLLPELGTIAPGDTKAAMAVTLDAVGSTHATELAVHRDRTIALVADGRVQLCNAGCVAKQTLSLPPAEGDPVLVDIAGDFLGVVTSNNVLRLFDLQKREARPYGVSKVLDTAVVSAVSSIAMSPDGTRVCLLCDMGSIMHVYMAETGRIISHNFGDGHTPTRAFWDPSYPKLLAVDVRKSGGISRVAVLFSPPESDLNVMERPALLSFEMLDAPRGTEGLLGIEAPRVFFAIRTSSTAMPSQPSVDGTTTASLISTVRLRDFASLPDATTPATGAATRATRDAVLGFSYCVALGDMDGAYTAIRAVQSPAVWSGMAQMIIKARRGDLLPALAVCLGNMGNARAAAALRTSSNEQPSEARLACVAVHLGMVAEAEELLRGCGRWDLLNRLAQNSGRWEQSVAMAEEHDRVHLRATHFACARYYEAVSDAKRASDEYERADTHRAEVPRMLCEFGQLTELDRYVDERGGDQKLLQWRGRYAESRGDFAAALAAYERAADWHSVVRLLCFQGKTDEAAAVVERCNDRAAAYHLARQLEGVGTDEAARTAMKLLGKAGALGHALRVAMEQGLDGDVAALALQGSQAQQLNAARYLEGRSLFDKAAMLYHKAGSTARAVALCFKGGLHAELAHIAGSLDAHADPELVMHCADWMMERGQHAEAVPLYIAAGQQAKALDICAAYGVPITDELAQRMSPPETEEPARRNRILRMIAKACDRQGNFALAAKTYTQARDTAKAMKSLIKTGDTEKVIFFAQVSQSAETYAMAANYLQTREWRTNPEFMRHIIAFYKKARAMDSLARFYESCAHVEVDEYRNYEKALGALREALLYAHRSKTADGPRIVASIEAEAKLVQQFTQARKLFQGGQEAEAIAVCQELVNATAEAASGSGAGAAMTEQLVQVGTVYSLLVEYFHSKKDMQQAHALMEQMHSRKIEVLQNIPEDVVRAVYSALSISMDHLLGQQQQQAAGADGQPQQRLRSAAHAMAPTGDDVQEELEVGGDADGGGSSDVEEDIQRQDDEEAH